MLQQMLDFVQQIGQILLGLAENARRCSAIRCAARLVASDVALPGYAQVDCDQLQDK